MASSSSQETVQNDSNQSMMKTSVRVANFTVEQFNGMNDFTLWQQRVKNILTREGTVKALKKKSEMPENMSIDAWQDIRDLATSTIQMYLADNTLREVIGLTDPEVIWTKLESRYKSKSLTNRLYLKKKLYGLKLKEPDDFGKHLDEFNRIVTELASLDEKIEEEDKALLLLASLPESFDNIVTTLLFGKDTLKLDDVIGSLLINDARRKSNGEMSSGNENALSVSGGHRYRGRSSDGRNGSDRGRSASRSGRSIVCWECGKKGHIRRNCRKWKDSQNNEKADEAESSERATVATEYGSELLATTDTGMGGNDWILDSGCSFHMCAAKEQFSTYEECDGGTVKMANKSESKIAGVGTVQIRMFDGIVRTLADVKHVPDLRMNLISLGTLDSRGYEISAGGGVLKVKKGAMVILKGQRTGSLYRLIGNVKTGGVPVRSQSAGTGGVQISNSVADFKKRTFASVVSGNLSGQDRSAVREMKSLKVVRWK